MLVVRIDCGSGACHGCRNVKQNPLLDRAALLVDYFLGGFCSRPTLYFLIFCEKNSSVSGRWSDINDDDDTAKCHTNKAWYKDGVHLSTRLVGWVADIALDP